MRKDEKLIWTMMQLKHGIELWVWLAQHPLREKHDWPEWEYNGGSVAEVSQDCFACEIDFAFNESTIPCAHCPLDWRIKYGSQISNCDHRMSAYSSWVEAQTRNDLVQAKKYALTIAKLHEDAVKKLKSDGATPSRTVPRHQGRWIWSYRNR